VSLCPCVPVYPCVRSPQLLNQLTHFTRILNKCVPVSAITMLQTVIIHIQ
jgi:hypothetical protein